MLKEYGLELSKKGDFIVKEIVFVLTSLRDSALLHEIGGKNKTKKQIKDIQNSYLVLDDIEIGSKRVIPLWLFGF